MNIIDLEKEQEFIENYIYRYSNERINKNREPITDGIINIKKYCKNKLKICWILKEAYDNEYKKGNGGGWSLVHDFLINDNYINVIKHPTWQGIIYTTYCILMNRSYYDVDYIRDNIEMANVIENIAVININKMPAKQIQSSPENIVKKEYEYWRPLLHWQLKQYKPNILIFGNTFQHFQKDLYIKNNIIKKNGDTKYVIKNDILYIKAKHPSNRSSRDKYVNEINDIVKKYMRAMGHVT